MADLLSPTTYLGLIGRRIEDARTVLGRLESEGIVVVEGPLGSGKTSLTNYVALEEPGYVHKIKMSTRRRRRLLYYSTPRTAGGDRGLIIVEVSFLDGGDLEYLDAIRGRDRVLVTTIVSDVDPSMVHRLSGYSKDEVGEILRFRVEKAGVDVRGREIDYTVENSYGDAFVAVLSLYYYHIYGDLGASVTRALAMRLMKLTDAEREVFLNAADGLSVNDVYKRMAGRYTKRWISRMLDRLSLMGLGKKVKSGNKAIWYFSEFGKAVKSAVEVEQVAGIVPPS